MCPALRNLGCIHCILAFRIRSGYLHQTLNISRSYLLSFIVKPLGSVSERSEILSFKTLDDIEWNCITFEADSTMLRIHTRLSKADVFVPEVIEEKAFPIMVYSSIKVTQLLNPRGFYDYKLFINDSLVFNKENRFAEQYQDVAVYTSSPSSAPADAVISDLKLENLHEPG